MTAPSFARQPAQTWVRRRGAVPVVLAAVAASAHLSATVGVASGQSASAAPAGAPSADIRAVRVIGITAPARTAVIAPVIPARIAEIHAVEGTSMRDGDLLVVLEDDVQRVRTEVARASAESRLDVELAEVRWEHARMEFERVAKLGSDSQASAKELIDARAAADAARLGLQIARHEYEQAQRRYDQEKAMLAQFRLHAPFPGYVAEQVKEVGESVDQLEGILKLVQLDPLHVTVDCPLALAPTVRVGERFWIRPVDEQWTPRQGTVVLAHRVADAASQTFRVRLAIDNHDGGWMAGLKVVVDFAQQVARREAAP